MDDGLNRGDGRNFDYGDIGEIFAKFAFKAALARRASDYATRFSIFVVAGTGSTRGEQPGCFDFHEALLHASAAFRYWRSPVFFLPPHPTTAQANHTVYGATRAAHGKRRAVIRADRQGA